MDQAENGPPPGVLEVSAMPQRRHIRSTGDDWTGVTSTYERRKLQNRLNQRARRYRIDQENKRKTATVQRRAALAKLETSGTNEDLSSEAVDFKTKDEYLSFLGPFMMASASSTEETNANTEQAYLSFLGHLMMVSAQDRERIYRFARDAHKHYSLGLPRPNQLHMLVKLNALDAIARNATLIGVAASCLCDDEMISRFFSHGPTPPSIPLCPKFLEPTSTQKTVSHHPWLDMFPFPTMRDKAIRAVKAELLDEDEFCTDLLGINANQADAPCLMVWGESSDPRNWELTMSFMHKYGWLVWGDPNIFESSNYWREKRGEKQIGW